MRFVVVLVVFWFNAAAAQEGYLGCKPTGCEIAIAPPD